MDKNGEKGLKVRPGKMFSFFFKDLLKHFYDWRIVTIFNFYGFHLILIDLGWGLI